MSPPRICIRASPKHSRLQPNDDDACSREFARLALHLRHATWHFPEKSLWPTSHQMTTAPIVSHQNSMFLCQIRLRAVLLNTSSARERGRPHACPSVREKRASSPFFFPSRELKLAKSHHRSFARSDGCFSARVQSATQHAGGPNVSVEVKRVCMRTATTALLSCVELSNAQSERQGSLPRPNPKYSQVLSPTGQDGQGSWRKLLKKRGQSVRPLLFECECKLLEWHGGSCPMDLFV